VEPLPKVEEKVVAPVEVLVAKKAEPKVEPAALDIFGDQPAPKKEVPKKEVAKSSEIDIFGDPMPTLPKKEGKKAAAKKAPVEKSAVPKKEGTLFEDPLAPKDPNSSKIESAADIFDIVEVKKVAPKAEPKKEIDVFGDPFSDPKIEKPKKSST